ncbi:MAG TPA: DUF423 domain-containing protein [Chryseosolibacter sp.]|nr:DUF423 domain-containing protein [Chryseosolibacter sp.]
MSYRNSLLTGIFFAGLGVVMAALGDHLLKDMLWGQGRAETYATALRYQFYHAFALLFTGLLLRAFETPAIKYAASCFVFGIFFFCGSLYVVCFTGIGIVGAITPVGGVLFIAGWALLLAGIIRKT